MSHSSWGTSRRVGYFSCSFAQAMASGLPPRMMSVPRPAMFVAIVTTLPAGLGDDLGLALVMLGAHPHAPQASLNEVTLCAPLRGHMRECLEVVEILGSAATGGLGVSHPAEGHLRRDAGILPGPLFLRQRNGKTKENFQKKFQKMVRYVSALDERGLDHMRQIDDLLNDDHHAGLSAPNLASLQFCLKLSRHALSVCSKDIEALQACGFDDESILEAVVVTALAVYRCTLSVGLGPEPDFESRKIASTRFGSPREGEPHGLLPDKPEAARRKGPYLPAPYLSATTFAPFAIVQKSHGFIPNFFRAQTLRPDLLEAELEAEGRILQPEDVLTRRQKECILLAVSAANLNSYCVAVHCNLLRGLGMPPEEGDQIAVDHHQSGLSEADMALLDFAVKLGTRASEFSFEDIVKLQKFGFTEEQILECEVVTALNNFANTLQMGLGIEPDFEPPLVLQENNLYLPVADRRHTSNGRIRPASDLLQDLDDGLVAQAQSGKLEAFEELVRRHTRLIYRTLTAILGNQVDAQDAMQDALLGAFKHIGGFQGRSKFSTWLVSIVRNTALQRLRRRKDVESLDEGGYEEDRDFRPRQVRAWEANPEQHYLTWKPGNSLKRVSWSFP